MKKIIVDKEDGVAEVIDSVLNEPDKDVILVVPKGSALGKSARNFHLLKREVDAAGRSIAIESVDEAILQFAKDSDIEASHPLWRGVRGAGGVSDIVPKTESMEEEQEAIERRIESSEDEVVHVPLKRSGAAGKKRVEEPAGPTITSYGGEEDDEAPNRPAAPFRPADDDDDASGDGSPRRRLVWWIASAIVAILVVMYVLSTVFAHADVTIDFQKTPWSYSSNFVADASATSITAANVVTIPAQVFTSTKNTTQTFPATGSSNDSQKAKGTIAIYNNYGTAPQELVATTRFLTPDGKIFRLVANVTVPGAKSANGTLTPSSVTAAIVADQAGPAYNLGPVQKLTIPGFANDPGREAGFYGAITGTTSGGSNGTHAVPTAGDIASAKASTTAVLQAALTGNLSASYPNNFKILDGATDIQITKLTVNTTTDSNGNFTVFGEASLRAIGFDEAALKNNYLLPLAQATEPSSTFSSIDLSYGSVNANFTRGQVAFSLSAQANLEPAFSPGDFAASIAGKSINGARDAVVLLPNLADGKISVWPLWLWTIPSNPGRIHVSAN